MFSLNSVTWSKYKRTPPVFGPQGRLCVLLLTDRGQKKRKYYPKNLEKKKKGKGKITRQTKWTPNKQTKAVLRQRLIEANGVRSSSVRGTTASICKPVHPPVQPPPLLWCLTWAEPSCLRFGQLQRHSCHPVLSGFCQLPAEVKGHEY